MNPTAELAGTQMRHDGSLIVLEGPDGVGKSTLAALLASGLRKAGKDVAQLSFPGQEPGSLGELVYRLHHQPRALGVDGLSQSSLQILHVAAHIDVIQRQIGPMIRRGMIVMLDRFWWSTWVYGLQSGISRPLLKRIVGLEKGFWGKTKPDLVMLIRRHMPFREEGTAEGWQLLKKAYDQLASEQEGQYPIQVVDNEGPLGETVTRVMDSVATAIAKQKPSLIPSVAGKRATSGQLFDHEGAPCLAHRLRAKDVIPTDRWAPAEPTVVFNTYWQFATERQAVFFRRLHGKPAPWTDDPIVRRHKFTNAYRVLDRASQFLIRDVIYHGSRDPEEIFFRIITFKLFNKIETWQLLKRELGEPTWRRYSFDAYDRVLTAAMSRGQKIYSAAYVMPTGEGPFGHKKKHRNHLKLIELMMADGLPSKLKKAGSMREGFELLKSYPTIGDFLAYQFITDVNYSELTDFSEMEFVVPGPGAKDGIRKCFRSLGGLNEAEIIGLMAERQEEEFARLGIQFQWIGGRKLQLIDCQNLFCEVDKYARVAHPDIPGVSGRQRIKQVFHVNPEPIAYWFPPKWHIEGDTFFSAAANTHG
jgi:thymidylate kinase